MSVKINLCIKLFFFVRLYVMFVTYITHYLSWKLIFRIMIVKIIIIFVMIDIIMILIDLVTNNNTIF